MPKIDLANVEVIRRLVYPEPFYRETDGYEGQRVGNAAGLTQFGVNRAVLPPGGRTALRHWHEAEDEFVIVVSGKVMLRDETARRCFVPATAPVSGQARRMATPSRTGRTSLPCCSRSGRAQLTRSCIIRMLICGSSGATMKETGSARTERPTIKGWLSNAAFGDPAGTVQLEYKHRDCHQPGKQPVGDQFLAAVFHVRPVDPVHEQECDTGQHDKDQTD